MRLFLLAALFALCALPAQADTIYSYTSDVFSLFSGSYQAGGHTSGTFTLSDDFVVPGGGNVQITDFVTGYSFTDGIQIFTPENSTGSFSVSFFSAATDQSRFSWQVSISNATGGLETSRLGFDHVVIAWEGGPSFTGFTPCSGNPRDVVSPLCAIDPSQSSEIITDLDSRIGGGPGTWTVQKVTSVPEGGTTAEFTLAGLLLISLWKWSQKARSRHSLSG